MNKAQPNIESVEPDWKAIAMVLKERLTFALSYGKFGAGFMLDMETGSSQNVKDYFADGLEMIPGLKVNRELMHMTPAQRRKVAKAKTDLPDGRA